MGDHFGLTSHLNNIKMKTIIVLAFITTMVLVIKADLEEEEDYDLTIEELDNISNLEVARHAREAEAGRRKGGRKQRKNGNRKKKAGKRKRKGGKNHRKGRKISRKGDKKGRKAGKKERKNGKAHRKVDKTPRAGCSRDVNSTCVDTAVKLINTVNTKIINYLKQQKRIAKFNNTRRKKSLPTFQNVKMTLKVHVTFLHIQFLIKQKQKL